MREVRMRDVALSLALVAFAVLSPLISLSWATKTPLDYAVGYALGSLVERMPATVLLRVFLEVPKGAEGLTFYVRVYHLRLEGADRVGEVSVVPEQVPQDGIKFQLRVQKVFKGYTEVRVGGRWVRRPLYKYQYFYVTAAAYDRESGALYDGSRAVAVDPRYYAYDVTVKVVRLGSKKVPADKVPKEGQVKYYLDQRCPNVVVFALSIPRGGKSRYYVPEGMPIRIQCFEKEWWTDDPSLEEWYEEPWEPAGSVPITVIRAGPAENLGTASSRYWFPINVDFVWYTIKETTPVYIIRLLQNPMDDCGGPEALATGPWTPSYKTYLGDMPRGYTCYLTGIRRTVAYRIQPKSFTFTFVSVAGPRTAEVTFSGSIEFTIEPQNFEIKIGMYDWSMAPPDAAKLVVYASDSSRNMLAARYESD